MGGTVRIISPPAPGISNHFAESCWFDIPNHFALVELGEFVVMPDHIHGIVIINKTDSDHNHVRNVGAQNFAPLGSPQPTPIGPETSLVPNPKIWHPSFVDLKLVLQKMPE
jgi:REP element-mobilizing transposase RayT